jgi:hypothetical protein
LTVVTWWWEATLTLAGVEEGTPSRGTEALCSSTSSKVGGGVLQQLGATLLLSNSSWGLRGLDSDFRFDGECFSAATNTEIQLERFENRNLIDPLIKKAFKTN